MVFYLREQNRTDLIFAVVTDVIHAHENSQKLPVFLKVETLEGGDNRGVKRGQLSIPLLKASPYCTS